MARSSASFDPEQCKNRPAVPGVLELTRGGGRGPQ